MKEIFQGFLAFLVVCAQLLFVLAIIAALWLLAAFALAAPVLAIRYLFSI